MSTYDTNVLKTSLQNPINLAVSNSVDYGSTFYTAQSTLSASNFAANTTLSATYTDPILIDDNISSASFVTITTAMATASAADHVVYATGAFFLSATGGVTHVTYLSGGSIGGVDVFGIAFNKLADDLDVLDYNTTKLSAFNGINFTVNDAYDGDEMAFILTDRTVRPFTVTTSFAQTKSQTISAASQDSVPEFRRLVCLGYM